MSDDEIQDVIDEDDNILDKLTRKEIKKNNLLHRGVFVFVFNSKGEIFLQKRSMNKTLYPGLWGIGAGGGVIAGESYDEAAKRELKEELGIEKPIEFIFDFRYESKDDNYKGKVYKLVYDGKIKIAKREIDEGHFKTIDEIKEMIKRDLLCPDTVLRFKKYLELIK
jgi:isopentenyldiphosphate isomerase